MRRAPALAWLLLGAALVALVALTLFGGQTRPPSTHSSSSDAADGTSALYRAAAAAGHPTSRLGAAGEAAAGAVEFIFSPNRPYSAAEARGFRTFVEKGGTLVYASERPDQALEGEFGLARQPPEVGDLVAYPPGPLLKGVAEVSGGASAEPFSADPPGAVPLLRGPQREILALEERAGAGTLVALADPLVLCNGNLLRSDNAAFAADLLGLAPAGAPVSFDESHHAAAAVQPAEAPAGVSPWIAAIIWSVVATYLALALRGRAFGPFIPLTPPRARSSAEYVDAVGNLLRRSGGRAQALDILVRSTRLRVGRRSARLSGEVEELQARTGGRESDAALLEAARQLHELMRQA